MIVPASLSVLVEPLVEVLGHMMNMAIETLIAHRRGLEVHVDVCY